jgi:hypothetical protein
LAAIHIKTATLFLKSDSIQWNLEINYYGAAEVRNLQKENRKI